jgi:hypothetical protein
MFKKRLHRVLLVAAMALTPFLMGSNCVVVGIPDGFLPGGWDDWGYESYDFWYEDVYYDDWGWYDYDCCGWYW